MKEFDKMSLSERIILLNYIEKNLSDFKSTWDLDKVKYLRMTVRTRIEALGLSMFKQD